MLKILRSYYRLLAAGVIMTTIAVSFVAYFYVRVDTVNLRKHSRDELVWAAAQVEIDLIQLQTSLANFRNPLLDLSPAEVTQRFDQLSNRVLSIGKGDLGQRLLEYDAESHALRLLSDGLTTSAPTVENLRPADYDAANRLLSELSRHASGVRRISRVIGQGEDEFNEGLRGSLSRSSALLTVLSVVMVLTSLALILFFRVESNRFQVIAGNNRKLFQDAEKAHQAKSQFLSMMSHELRTPMNGVLGLIALARQQGVSGGQARLLDQAERSGRQMNALLTDILDFSALQEDNLELERKPFEIYQLSTAIAQVFEPLARREGVGFSVHVEPGEAAGPAWVSGDFRRLRQSLIHLAAYFVETAGTDNISMVLSHSDGNFCARLSYDYTSQGGEWEPSLILGQVDRGRDNFASDALGPAVARGLIEKMGGSITFDMIKDERIAILVLVPAPLVVMDQIHIRIETKSEALKAICKASLAQKNIRFYDPEATGGGKVNIVLLEADWQDEATRLTTLRQQHPEALMISLGKPLNAQDFDDQIGLPIDYNALKNAPFLNRVS